MSDKKQGIIYIFTNPAMPNYIKVGKTKNWAQRLKDMDGTNTPLPFICFYACEVKDMDKAEQLVHDAFKDQRIRSNREFFEVDPERVRSALRLGEVKEINLTNIEMNNDTDNDNDREEVQRAIEKINRRENFSFDMVDIPVGSHIRFIREDKSKIAEVMDNKNIKLDGEITSLSAAAQKLLGYNYPVQGTAFWEYEQETLDERRKRMAESSESESENKRCQLKYKFWETLLEKSKNETDLFSNKKPHTWTCTLTSKKGIEGLEFGLYINKNSSYIALCFKEAFKPKIMELKKELKNKLGVTFEHEIVGSPVDNPYYNRLRAKFETGGWNNEEQWESIQDNMIKKIIELEKAIKPHYDQLRGLKAVA